MSEATSKKGVLGRPSIPASVRRQTSRWVSIAILGCAVVVTPSVEAEPASHVEARSKADVAARVSSDLSPNGPADLARDVSTEDAADPASDVSAGDATISVADSSGGVSTEAVRDQNVGSEVASSWLPELRPERAARIQNRLFTKKGRVHLSLGGEYLARGDFHQNPGVTAGVSWFFHESWALEVGASRFFSSLNPIARDVREASGFVPDSRRPQWLFRLGLRVSAGYGKVLILGRIIHWEPQLFARASLLISEGALSPGGEVGVGLHVNLTRALHLRLDVAAFPHAERRSRWRAVLGVAPTIAIGYGVP